MQHTDCSRHQVFSLKNIRKKEPCLGLHAVDGSFAQACKKRKLFSVCASFFFTHLLAGKFRVDGDLGKWLLLVKPLLHAQLIAWMPFELLCAAFEYL